MRYDDAIARQIEQLRFLETERGLQWSLKVEDHSFGGGVRDDVAYETEALHEFDLNALRAAIEHARLDQDQGMPRGYLYFLQRVSMVVADTLFISSDATEMIDYARGTFEPEPLLESDPLTPCGFAVFANPITLDQGSSSHDPYDIHAIGWTQAHLTETDGSVTGQVFWISMYDRPPEQARRGHPGLMCRHTFGWQVGSQPRVDDIGERALVQTMWRLASQVIRTTERPSRGLRRDAARAGLDESDVLVVTLRRRRVDPGPGQADLPGPDWKHQWMVRGHWRNQWYPSLEAHRQIWISPYAKGPEDKPLKISHRVFNFTR